MNELNYRYIARIKVEATTPIFIGSGGASLITDSLALKDHNGLPFIPGTSLAGVLRHSLEDFSLEKKVWKDIFGFQGQDNEGQGSRLIISSAYLILNDGKVAEGIETSVPPEILRKFDQLPTRQHVRITHKGVAADKGLFDNEVVYAGARFIFEIELKGSEGDQKAWDKIIEEIKSPAFRIGQGTRNGYGNLKVLEIFAKKFDLKNEDNFNDYMNFNPSFNTIIEFDLVETDTNKPDYELQLKPDDFFIFSEGFGDDEVDNKPVTEEVMVYEKGQLAFKEKTLIPATSIKGTIAHRVAFHYNKLKGNYADKISEDSKNYIEEKNLAVAALFGEKADFIKNKGQHGILILDDLYYDNIDNSKIFNHVAIDRFTGGAIDGALFSEKVSHMNNDEDEIVLKINLSKSVEDETIITALEETLKDICKGLLPLGGMVTKGHGMFTGKLLKAGELLFDYKSQKENAL